MGFFSDFKGFIFKGNILDLAVGVIIGGAFGKIVSSFVADVIMPPIGLLMGGVNFTDLKLVLKEGVAATATSPEVAAVTLNYGMFLQTLIDFLIIALVIFMVLKAYNNMQKAKEEAPAPPPAPSAEEVLLGEIRDLLKKG
ncbi:large-conductance mechanosensitive channel protein MscL [Sphingobacteriales bacterium UPWRP_1]|nr:large-conductance mechanosensitive channel [Sphingobacteriales bacterium TSM_CSM]PSJ72026.1 large-conductance mechanosensitive channel protein MscL [Sphingobacteriales bacterium UPWRP_1]